jgi:2-succinyl-5-enolpyruvyl-6-hydroxy-3-cyclohexene-1-carboxylate synthase
VTAVSLDPPENLLGEWARVVASTLAERGVSDVVLSPGSRSTPYVIAIARQAGLRCHDVLDERVAAFLALGMARASGRTIALLCTSGTAGAHWYPAVIEASLAHLPLVLLTTDRPLELVHCGAPQTIDQIDLFGKHVRFAVETGTPDPAESALRGLRRAVAPAIAPARGPKPGPVHVNLRARKPLEPVEPHTEAGLALRARVDRILSAPAPAIADVEPVADPLAIDRAAALIGTASRPVIVAGPLPATAVEDGTRSSALALVRATGAPLFAEATSQLRLAPRPPEAVIALDALDLVLQHGDRELEPDLVIQIGATATSSALDRWIAARPDLPRIVVGVRACSDPHGTARVILVGDPAPTLCALARAIAQRSCVVDEAWRARLRAANCKAMAAIDAELETGGFGEGAVARTVAMALPAGTFLALGNSLPVRTVDRFVPSGANDLRVLSQRGANGIDGLVSGAIGASLATGTPGALLLGDLSLLHDLGGLATAPLLRAPLAIVVVQNGGGRIFEQLPIARDPALAWALPHFVTPHTVVLEHVAAAFGLPYCACRDAHQLRGAIERAMRRPGATLIEAFVPEHGARDAEERIGARVRAALASLRASEP